MASFEASASNYLSHWFPFGGEISPFLMYERSGFRIRPQHYIRHCAGMFGCQCYAEFRCD